MWNIKNNCGINYVAVGLDFVSSGGQGGLLIMIGKCGNRDSYVGLVFLVIYSVLPLVIYVVLVSRVFMLGGATIFPFAKRYALIMVLQHCFGCFLMLRFSILTIALQVWFLQVTRTIR